MIGWRGDCDGLDAPSAMALAALHIKRGTVDVKRCL